MTSNKKPYKLTKDVRIYDVPKVYVEMFNNMHRMRDGIEGQERSRTEFFNDLVMYAYSQYFGEEMAAKKSKEYQNREKLFAMSYEELKVYRKQNNLPPLELPRCNHD